MNLYGVGRLFYEIRNPELQQKYRENPEAVWDKYGLDAEDRQIIRDKNTKAYFDAGLHPILLIGGARALGMPAITLNVNERPRYVDNLAGLPPEEAEKIRAQHKVLTEQLEREFKLVKRP